MSELTWPMKWALRELRMRGGWVIREETVYAPNTLDALVRRGLAEARGGERYAEAYRVTDAGRALDLTELERIT